MILYGPPGTGKTTLARLLAVNARAAPAPASARATRS
ncbi:MAG: AAA family ATPase [Solirubrobacteraceae bacterium]